MRKSIKGQLTLLFVLLGLTPIAVTFAIYSPGMLKDLTVQVTQGLCTDNRSQVRLVALWLREKLKETELLATSPQLVSCLKSAQGINADQLQQFLDDKRFTGLCLFDKNGELRAHAGKDAEVVLPHLDKERLREILRGSPSLYCPPAGVHTERMLPLFISVPVSMSETKEVVGALVTGIDPHQTKGILGDISIPNTYSFLVNDSGNVLACPTSGPALNHIGSGPAWGGDTTGGGGRATPDKVIKTVGERPVNPLTGSLTEGVRACLEGKKAASASGGLLAEGYSPYAYTSHLGLKVLGAWGWIPELGVGVIVEVDAKEAFWPISVMRGRLWWLLLIIGIGVTIVAVFTGRKLSEPIISLTSTTQKIAQGELAERADIQSPNEIGELAQCINTMAESLQEKNIQLAKLNEELRLLKRR